MMDELFEKLSGADLRSIGKANLIVNDIKNQNDFDILFSYLYSNDRLIVMRAADAIEKITAKKVDFLPPIVLTSIAEKPFILAIGC